HRHRVVEPHPLGVVLAADELHARAFPQVHRRDHDHRVPPPLVSSATNARTNASPAALLFSGWNCAPTTRPRRTAAGKRSPSCSLHAITDASPAPGRQT